MINKLINHIDGRNNVNDGLIRRPCDLWRSHMRNKNIKNFGICMVKGLNGVLEVNGEGDTNL